MEKNAHESLSKQEQKRIARELGISIEDLSLQPTKKDLIQVNTPARKDINSCRLQAIVYPESDLDNESSTSFMQDASITKFLNSTNVASPMSTPRRQTYTQFRKSQGLTAVQNRISKHYSSVLKPGEWDLNDSDDVLQVIFTEEMRRKKRRNLASWAIFTSILFLYISFLLGFFYKQWTTECIRQLSVWLAVYDGIIIMQLIRALFLIRVWKISRDPAMIQVTIDCFWSIVYLSEIGWSIYGNTFIYSSGSQYCTGAGDKNIDAFALWVSALILIVWGYCLMLYLLGIILFAIGLCCIYRSWSIMDLTKIGGRSSTDKDDEESNHRSTRRNHLSNAPILSSMENYRICKYEQMRFSKRHSRRQMQHRSWSQPLTMIDTTSCGLCMEEFR